MAQKTAHNSKDNGLTGIGNSHKPDSFLTIEFAEGSTLALPFDRLREAVNIGVWYTPGNIPIRLQISTINGAVLRGRQLNHIAPHGTMWTNYGEIKYTISHCSCSLCNGTELTLLKKLDNDSRWTK